MSRAFVPQGLADSLEMLRHIGVVVKDILKGHERGFCTPVQTCQPDVEVTKKQEERLRNIDREDKNVRRWASQKPFLSLLSTY